MRRVARGKSKTRSHLLFAPSTRTISAEGCAGQIQNALSPAYRAFDTHDLRMRRVAPDKSKTRSHLHIAPSTRAISADGCAGQIQNALSPAFRVFDTHDLRRGLRRTALDTHDLRRGLGRPGQKRNLTCISRPRHARSPQRVARDRAKTQIQNAISPALRALDTHDLRRGLRFVVIRRIRPRP